VHDQELECKKHGKLSQDNLIKKGKNKNGSQRFRCKQCMKGLHRAYYEKNKDKLLRKTKQYREENKELVKKWKRNDQIINREKYRPRKRERDKKANRHAVKNLTDTYIKHLLTKKSDIKYKDIPQPLIDLKRTVMKIKRLIKRNKI
jgi:transposase-like protein